MADGSIKFDTKINLDGFKKDANTLKRAAGSFENSIKQAGFKTANAFTGANKEVDRLARKVAEAEAKLEDLLEVRGRLENSLAPMDLPWASEEQRRGVFEQNAQWQKMTVDIGKAEAALASCNQEFQAASVKAQVYETETEEVAVSQDKVTMSAKRMDRQLEKTRKRSAIPLSKSIFKLSNMFKLMLIRMAMRSVINAAKEGLQNLAQYSDETNQSMSELKSGFTQTKNTMATAFAPALIALTPHLTRIINLFNSAASAAGMFIAALTGKSTVTKAVAVQEDYAASLKKSAGAASDLNGELYSFDKLSKVSGSESSGSSSGSVDPSKMFTEVQIPSAFIDGIAVLQDMLSPTTDALGDFWTALQPFNGTVGSGLQWLYLNALLPLGSWTFGQAVPLFLSTLGGEIGVLDALLWALQPGWQWFWDNILAPAGEVAGVFIIEALLWLNQQLAGLSGWIVAHQEEISQFGAIMLIVGSAFLFAHGGIKLVTTILPLALKLMTGLSSFMMSPLGIIAALAALVVWAGNGEEMLEHLKTAFGGLLDFVVGVFTGDWERAWNGIKNIFKGVFNGIITILESAANFIVSGLNKISFEVPDWVPAIGGRHFGFSISSVHLPRLATGTVVPPRAGEFAAILGDNNREAEVVSPISSMKQAFKEAIMEMGGIGGASNVVIEFRGSLAALGRLLTPIIRREEKRQGVNLVEGGNR